jgi:hypothetical protein
LEKIINEERRKLEFEIGVLKGKNKLPHNFTISSTIDYLLPPGNDGYPQNSNFSSKNLTATQAPKSKKPAMSPISPAKSQTIQLPKPIVDMNNKNDGDSLFVEEKDCFSKLCPLQRVLLPPSCFENTNFVEDVSKLSEILSLHTFEDDIRHFQFKLRTSSFSF